MGLTAVGSKGRDSNKCHGLAPAEAAELGHPTHERRGSDEPDAGDRSQNLELFGMLRVRGDCGPDLDRKQRDLPVEVGNGSLGDCVAFLHLTGRQRKIREVVGLYVNPPDHAVILSVDEETQIPAPSRTQKPLPIRSCHPETRSHDNKRNGTTCLMAALNVATGRVVGQMTSRHRSEEFIAFLDHVAKNIEPDTKVHAILDSVSSHNSAQVHDWLKHHPDWSFHFTPTSASCTNAVEGFFSRSAWPIVLASASAIRFDIKLHHASIPTTHGQCTFTRRIITQDLVHPLQKTGPR